MKNGILPIGSIIRVNNEDLMICSYFKKDTLYNGERYDYVCCKYPKGISADSILVRKDVIQKVIFIGFQDERFRLLKEELES